MPPLDSSIFVLKQPLWKRAGLLLGSVIFVIGGIYIALAGNIVGLLCSVLFGVCGIVILFAPRTILIADAEGVTPTFVLRRGSPKKIPWAMIEKIDVATERTFNIATSIPIRSKHRFLAIYLSDKNFLTADSPTASAINEAGMQILQGSGLMNLDDGGSAQVYIPAAELPGWSVEKVAEKLNALRPPTSTPVSSSIISNSVAM